MRILIILGADAALQSSAVPEFDGLIDAYYLFRDAGMDVVVAAPGGGSASEGPATARARQRFKSDRDARDALNDLVELGAIYAGDFEGALWLAPQGAGAMVDIQNDGNSLIAELLAAAKPVALVGAVRPDTLPGLGSGVLIVGAAKEAPRLAANALLGAMRSEK